MVNIMNSIETKNLTKKYKDKVDEVDYGEAFRYLKEKLLDLDSLWDYRYYKVKISNNKWVYLKDFIPELVPIENLTDIFRDIFRNVYQKVWDRRHGDYGDINHNFMVLDNLVMDVDIRGDDRFKNVVYYNKKIRRMEREQRNDILEGLLRRKNRKNFIERKRNEWKKYK